MSTDPLILEYRLSNLEKWRKTIEDEGLAKAFALAERDRQQMDRVLTQVLEIQKDHEQRIDATEETLDRRSGGLGSLKTAVTVGLVTLLLIGSFILQLATLIGST